MRKYLAEAAIIVAISVPMLGVGLFGALVWLLS